jgi:hypothetical protein
MSFEFVQANDTHALMLLQDLRDADKKEVEASHGMSAQQACLAAARTPEAKAIFLNGEFCGLFGILDVGDGVGSPWFLGTNAVLRNRKEFLKASRPIFELLSAPFSYLTNYVHVENKQSQRWIKFLGFTLYEPEPFGASGELFRPFDMRL